jgi:heat shock protein HspQ
MDTPRKDAQPSIPPAPPSAEGASVRVAKFGLGQVVRHRIFSIRGVVFDIDPVFANTEEWWLAIPDKVRPRKDQPFYHLLAENAESEYVAYVSEQNLTPDTSPDPIRHPQVDELFERGDDGSYRMKILRKN